MSADMNVGSFHQGFLPPPRMSENHFRLRHQLEIFFPNLYAPIAAMMAKWLHMDTYFHSSFKWPCLKVARWNPDRHLKILSILWQGLKYMASFGE